MLSYICTYVDNAFRSMDGGHNKALVAVC